MLRGINKTILHFLAYDHRAGAGFQEIIIEFGDRSVSRARGIMVQGCGEALCNICGVYWMCVCGGVLRKYLGGEGI